MATWCVYHLIHVRTPWQYIPRLVVTNVPDGEEITTDLLERAGYQYEEFGIPWANHGVERLDPKTSPSDLIARVRNGAGERISWADLIARANAPL